MIAKTFKDLSVWQEARILCLDIYKIMQECKDYGFKDQIQRASVSIMNNIAEGFASGSDAMIIRYFYIAKASCIEVHSMIILGKDLNYIKQDIELISRVEYITKGIQKFINSKKSK